LESLSIAFDREFVFPNPEKVYNAMFPENRPTFCAYKIDLDKHPEAHGLKDCVDIYNSVREGLLNYEDREAHLILLQKITHLQGCLGMHRNGPFSDGDIIFLERVVVANVFDISRTLYCVR